jgi:glycosyltransferase involved in cell wall biosynthesis/GT2 family glycosyltransferase
MSALSVTVVCPAGVVGGAELWLLELLAESDRLDVSAVLLAAGPMQAELDRLGARTRVLPTGRSGAAVARSARRLAGWLRADPPAVVLANGVKAAAVAAPAARLAGVRCCYAKHDHSYDRSLSPVLARMVDGVVATSPSLAAASGRPGAVVVPPPRPPRPRPRDMARLLLGTHGLEPADPRPVLATVGRLVGYKGVEDAIRGLACPGGQGWLLAVIGGPDPAEPAEPDRLRAVAAAAGVADRVIFTGPVPAAASLLTGVDAVAVLTKAAGGGPAREGFGTVALEAMTAGVPVIATSTGPVAARLGGRAGLVVPPGSPPAVGVALGRLSDPTVRERMGAAGRQLTADHPNARGCAGMLARELARIACRPGAGLPAEVLTGPPVSVVATVLNEGAAIDALLTPLAGQLVNPRDEVVIVDGGSRDDTVRRVQDWSRRDGRVRLLERPGVGVSAGRNLAIREATNDLIACTDAGCVPDPGWLPAYRAAAVDAARPGLLTGLYRVRGDRPVQLAMAAVGYPVPSELDRPSPLVRWYGRCFGRVYEASLPTGRSMAFPRSVWAAAGGFPEHLATGEDVMFGQSAVAAGAPAVLVAGALVAWAQRPTLAAMARMYFRYAQGSGHSRDRRLLGRDLCRAGVYAAGAVLLTRRRARPAAGLAAAAYLSLPTVRVLRGRCGGTRRDRLPALAAVPVVAAVRDLSKAAGALSGVLARERTRP